MSLFTDLAKKAVDLGIVSSGKAIKWVIGNPVASRVAGGMLIHKGLSQIGEELTAPQSERRGAMKYVSGGINLLLGGALAVWNDPSWYTNTGSEKYATSLNFNLRKGFRYSQTKQRDPHAVCYHLNMTVPYDRDLRLDTMVDAYYKSITTVNNRVGIYNSSYLRAYMVNVKPLICAYSSLVRLYGIINSFNSLDATIPYSILSSLNFTDADYNFLKNSMADLRMRLFSYAKRITANYPMMGDYLNRASWLCSNIYLDGSDSKAISILMDMKKYTSASMSNTGVITYASHDFNYQPTIDTSGAVGNASLDNVFKGLDAILNEIQTFNPALEVMLADITKAFGEKCFASLDVPEYDYSVMFMYNEEVLTMLENVCSANFNYVDSGTGYSRLDPSTTSNGYRLFYSNEIKFPTLSTPSGTNWVTDVHNNALRNFNGGASGRNLMTTVVNSPMVDPNVPTQFAYTRFTNSTQISIEYDTHPATASTPNTVEEQFRVYFKDSMISNSGEDVYGFTIAATDIVNATAVNIANINNDTFYMYQNLIFTQPGNKARLLSSESIGYIAHYWANIDWMPRLYVCAVDCAVTASTSTAATEVTTHITFAELFDEKVFATYDPELKSTFDSICNESLYYIDLLIMPKKDVQNLTQSIRSENKSNKGGHKPKKHKRSNKPKNNKKQNKEDK